MISCRSSAPLADGGVVMAESETTVTKAFFLGAGILLCALVTIGRTAAARPASAQTPFSNAVIQEALAPFSGSSGEVQRGCEILIRGLADDRDKDQDHDGDSDHDRRHHKDPDPGPAPVPEPATVLLFGAALLAIGTIVRRRSRVIHK